MAELLNLTTFTDSRGNLTVIERIIPFTIKRIFYIYGVDDSVRGGHRHKTTIQAAICLKGSCKIFNNTGQEEQEFLLNSASQCLMLQPNDWHKMYDFEDETILMVLASELYDPDDYIYDPYLPAV